MIDISGLLSAVYGTGSATGGTALSSNPVIALTIAENTETKAVAAQAKDPQTARDIADFQKAVAAAKTPADLLRNPTVLKVLLTSNGLSDQVGYPALAQKALLSDTSQTNALANQLSNTNWKTAAQTYAFATQGLSVIQDPATLANIAHTYAEVKWRQSLDAATPGLSNALTFRAQASSITSVDQILGNSTLRTVVTTALGLPKQIAYQQISTQEQAISSRLDITQFHNPAFVESFAKRYLLAASDPSNNPTPQQPDLTSLAVQAAGLVV